MECMAHTNHKEGGMVMSQWQSQQKIDQQYLGCPLIGVKFFIHFVLDELTYLGKLTDFGELPNFGKLTNFGELTKFR